MFDILAKYLRTVRPVPPSEVNLRLNTVSNPRLDCYIHIFKLDQRLVQKNLIPVIRVRHQKNRQP